MLYKFSTSLLVIIFSTIAFQSEAIIEQPTKSIESSIPSKELLSIDRIVNIIEKTNETNTAWPGYEISNVPVVIWFDSGHIFAINVNSSDKFWEKIHVRNTNVLFSTEDHWGFTKHEIHHKYPFENQNVYLFHFNLSSNFSPLPFIIFLHERFHPHQVANFINAKDVSEGYKDHLNPENLALIHLEHEVLIDFLRSFDQHKLEHLKDFYAVHKARLAFLNPSSVVWERHQQRMEGLADYVSFKTSDLTHGIPEFKGKLQLLFTLQAYSRDQNISELAIKQRHYGVGATLAYALDYLKVNNWKMMVESDGKGLDEIFMDEISLSDEESSERIERVKKLYEYEKIKKDLAESIEKYQDQIAGLINDYQTKQGITVVIQKPQGVSVNGGGSDIAMFFLPDGSTLSIDNTSVASTLDNNWKLSLNNVPYLFQTKTEAREFKCEEDLEIVIDQYSFKLRDLIKNGLPKAFKTISWKGKIGEFSSDVHPGSIEVREGKVCVEYHAGN